MALRQILDHKSTILLTLGITLLAVGFLIANQHMFKTTPSGTQEGWIETTGIILDITTFENSLPLKEQPYFHYKIGYMVGNKAVTSTKQAVPGAPPFKKGEEVPLWVNPYDNQNHYFPSYSPDYIAAIQTPKNPKTFYLIGILLVIAGTFFFIWDKREYRVS